MLFLLFQLGNDRYALEAQRVVEVVPYLALKKIPQSPKGVAGIFIYRGRPLPALDLCELTLDHPARERLSTRIIVIECGTRSAERGTFPTPPAAHRPSLLGLIAERATEMMRRDAGDFVDPGVKLAAAPFLGPVLLDDRGVIQLLRAEKLLAENVRELLLTSTLEPSHEPH